MIGDPPDIYEGQFKPRPNSVTPGDKTVQIGTPAYVDSGDNLTIVCNIASGTRPITIKWFRNRVEDTLFGNVSMITISNVNFDDDNGDVYTCRAENFIGFDEETTTLTVNRKYVCVGVPLFWSHMSKFHKDNNVNLLTRSYIRKHLLQ